MTKWFAARLPLVTLLTAAGMVTACSSSPQASDGSANVRVETPDDRVGRRGGAGTGAVRETIMILVGDKDCGASNVKELPGALRRIRTELDARALKSGSRVAYIGVALDWQVKDGLEFLAHFGTFDEVVVGGNWVGQGATRWIWRDMPGPASLPQLIIIERDVETRSQVIEISADREVARFVGSDRIIAWAEKGFPGLSRPAEATP